MTNADLIQTIAHLLKNDFDSQSEWDDPLTIKSSPHNLIAILYGAMVNVFTGDVWLKDGDGQWYQLEATDRNFDWVAPSVIQRLKYLKLTSVASYN